MVDAVVVGSGPNGLTGAVALARAGHRVTVFEERDTIGGGTRTEELTVPGVRHDVCSAVHPFAASSPLFDELSLGDHGLEWCRPDIDLAHPLDDGRAGVMVRSLDETVAGLGADGPAWRQVFEPLAGRFAALTDDLFQPFLHVPRHPVGLARFGVGALQPATWFARRWHGEEARALFGGVAAHIVHPLDRPATASVGLMMTAAGHHVGWPVAKGGSAAITDALASRLTSLGGTIETGVRVRSLAELPPSPLRLLDLDPRQVAALAGDALPAKVRKAYLRYRRGPAAFKIDLAVQDGVPWTAEPARRAATVHVGGTLEEIAAAELTVHQGRMAEQPFVLLAQQYLADPSRSAGDVHPIWAYCHVPNGYTGDATEAIMGQIERFAPGFRERVVATAVRRPVDIEAHNANYCGGDISTGANDPLQVVFRPRIAVDPYATGIAGTYICSAATPPGAGVHGMCGANAAARALAELPSLSS